MYLVRNGNCAHNHNAFNRLLDEWYDQAIDSTTWSPRMDVKESSESYNILADLPGLSKEEINISLHDNVLTLKGERKVDEKKEDENVFRSERLAGNFHRSIRLPRDIKANDVQAKYENGVLQLTIPKAEEAKPREITIS